ncbi:hypothetical protein AHF37_09722 [Paragonimus kellicotti]|nr:hypothetical protein AHF37_09722 [Paragonimus kellicotti]
MTLTLPRRTSIRILLKKSTNLYWVNKELDDFRGFQALVVITVNQHVPLRASCLGTRVQNKRAHWTNWGRGGFKFDCSTKT